MKYLENLNPEQKKAVLSTDGPVLIVAGAGAGKTKTLTNRIVYLLEKGVKPENILAITFTNKAAKEMRDRVLNMIDGNSRAPFLSTFHSFGVQIIKENVGLLNLPRHFSIFDSDDTKKSIKKAVSELGLEPKEYTEKIKHIISSEKNRGVSFKEYSERGDYDFLSELVKKIWAKYEETLKKERALDFDDLLLKTLKIFRNYPEILERYQDRFLYIHIDEYQDTNKIQNEIVELLAKKHRNICVVGDTDQCIYGWRGAEIKNMIHFEKFYPETKTFFLEQNYRSTKNILSVANEIIKKNNFRIPKTLFTEKNDGEKISLFSARSEVDEAHFVAMKSKELIEEGVNPESIAVLFRTNFQSRVLEDAFLAHNVPYQMIGTKFFERKEVKDVLSYIKASLSGESLSDFARIVNVPPRGIGKSTLEKVMLGKENELKEGVRLKVENFRKMLSDFKNILEKETLSEALKKIIKKSGLEDYYNTGVEEDTERLLNTMEVVTLAKNYDHLEVGEGLEKFLTDTALVSDQDTINDNKNGVRLMTVHSSKGLEFDYVFICGLENDLFPYNKEFLGKNKEDLEEERRLFYVAITRAGKKVFLTYAITRTIFGNTEVHSPSEFIDDIPAKFMEIESFFEQKKPLISIDF